MCVCVQLYLYVGDTGLPRLNPAFYEIPEIAVPTDPCDAMPRSAILYTCHAANLIRYDADAGATGLILHA